ncbi:unnamed protein product [Mytilus coruscus]|uniref:Uncharacterized protein n=1 Tax=Mytilus coruscus TaxID=42192 RepID=A0A6J8AAL2_MYTCO|nr:unnamed protein product [Mytilus coruscus]
MTEISLKSFSEIQLAIREYEIDTNSKFRVVKKDKYFGLEGTASLLLGIDDRLKEYIRKMVWEENITRVQQMRVLLEVYMKTTLFQGQDIPAIINKRFWPSNVDIQNHIALAVKKQRNKEIDQIDIKLSCLPTTIIQPLRLTLYLVVYQQLS